MSCFGKKYKKIDDCKVCAVKKSCYHLYNKNPANNKRFKRTGLKIEELW